MLTNARVPVLGFAAYSGVGKTTLLTKLLPLLTSQGLRIGMIKHAHHDFDIDKPGKDSYELRKAGAGQMLIASGQRWALMVEKDQQGDPDLDDMIAQLNQNGLDLILVEGFRHEAFAKIELQRPTLGRPPLYTEDKNIIAIATDEPTSMQTDLVVMDINKPEQIAEFVLRFIKT